LQHNIFAKDLAVSPKDKFIARFKQNETKFSPSDRRIADYLIRAYPGAMLETATEIAGKIGLNVSTITRFFPKIGYRSIRTAQAEFRQDLDFLKNSPLDRFRQQHSAADAADDLYSRAWNLDLHNLQQTYQRIPKDSVTAFVELVPRCSAIYIIGERKMFALSFYLFIQMHALHPRVIHVKTDQFTIADRVVDAGADDLLIVFDFRRYPKVNLQLAEVFKNLGGTIVVIGDSAMSPSSKYADLMFVVESRGISIFDSYTAGFALIHSLLAGLVQSSGGSVRQRYERLEEYYRTFGIFSSFQLNINLNKLPSKSGKPARKER
jgi:DNA-binding MurR/RpiR family transcriptional regulator